MLTMRQDGVLKVLSGTTSLAELARVIDLSQSELEEAADPAITEEQGR